MVAEQPDKIDINEIMRALTPEGVALIKEQEGWKKVVKSWPEGIDEWTHWRHGPQANPMAADNVVGPPRHLDGQQLLPVAPVSEFPGDPSGASWLPDREFARIWQAYGNKDNWE